MKNLNTESDSTRLSLKLDLPDDLHFKVLWKLVEDMSLDTDYSVSNPCIEEFRISLRAIIRSRSTDRLMEFVSLWNVQSILSVAKNRGEFFYLYQLTSFLKKYPFTGVDTRGKAIDTFEKYERTCNTFNRTNVKAILALNNQHPEFYGIIQELRTEIVELLGEDPPIDKIIGLAYHGPGTSALSKQHGQGMSTDFYKWSTLPYSVTPQAMPLVKQAILSDPRWIGALDDWYRRVKLNGNFYTPIDLDHFWSEIFCIVGHSRLTTVPKSAETDRTICIEPTGNVFLQLGVDGFIRGRLKKRWRVNLNSQEDNQFLAYEGSISDKLVTLDLRGASDTVALAACRLLLPDNWYDLLMTLRCHACEDTKTGKVYNLSKMSSMGNGFTFALESLLFAALVRISMKRTNSNGPTAVYGDDIIVPVSCYPFLANLLSLFGFSLNSDKSFSSGPFRESCGKDYYKGTNVRPVFLKKKIRTVTDLLYLHNSLYNLMTEKGELFLDVSRTCLYIRSFLPKWIGTSFFGPPSESLDTYIFSEKRCFHRSRAHNPKYFGRMCYHALRIAPKTWKWKYEDFYFIKLMANLRGRPTFDKWDWRSKKSGNAFAITRRDRTVCTVREVLVY